MSASETNAVQMPVLSDFKGQGALYDGLIRTLNDGTFVHAYLISGTSGMGKRTLARLIAQHLLCTGERKPCGACPACVQVREGSHPDVITISPGKPIYTNCKPMVDNIRILGKKVDFTKHGNIVSYDEIMKEIER